MDFENTIEQRRKSERYEYFAYGNDYYLAKNTAIMDRKKYIYLDGIGITENPFGANHRLPSGHFKKIVDQKVMYQLGNGVKWNEEQSIDEYFDDPFDEVIIDLGIEASKKAETWLMAYKDNGNLKFTQMPSEQLSPVFDEYGKLAQMVRTFADLEYVWIYVYTDQDIIRYRKRKEDKHFKQLDIRGHWTTYQTFNGDQVGDPEQHGFGIVPFIPLYNNREHTSDLNNIKTLIDTYDIINSDFANNIDDMQEAFLTLKGYTGDTRNLGEFMRQLKMYKAVPIDADGDVGVNQQTIPVEARKTFLERIEKDIYKFSMAVDLSHTQGGSITNVYIKSMFADLDLKADQFESEIRKFLKRLITFINIVDNKQYTYDCTFTREMIVNNSEVVETLVKMQGLISDQTIRELIPFAIDLKNEELRLADQKGDITLSME